MKATQEMGKRPTVKFRGEPEMFADLIVYAESRGAYTVIHRRNKGNRKDKSGKIKDDATVISVCLSEIQKLLPGFIRCHRSYLVNPLHVLKMERGSAGINASSTITLSDRTQIPVSKANAHSTVGQVINAITK